MRRRRGAVLTCIAGVVHRGRVHLLGDSAVTMGDDERAASAVPKVRRTGGYCYGVAGDGRACDVAVRWALPTWDGSEPRGWVVDVLAPVVRQRLHDCDEGKAVLDLLVGVGGSLVWIDSSLAAVVLPWGYGAIGAGASVALGALYATRRFRPRARLRAALEASARHCMSVGRPWKAVSA